MVPLTTWFNNAVDRKTKLIVVANPWYKIVKGHKLSNSSSMFEP